jgi:hypothetical protein
MKADMQKVKPEHLKRDAYLYVRQSTPRQVLENSESTKRQYALRQRAIALGWHSDHIVVIDNDLGQSGASAVDREGFKKLVAEVGMGHAGLVIGLEVSRLAGSVKSSVSMGLLVVSVLRNETRFDSTHSRCEIPRQICCSTSLGHWTAAIPSSQNVKLCPDCREVSEHQPPPLDNEKKAFHNWCACAAC